MTMAIGWKRWRGWIGSDWGCGEVRGRACDVGLIVVTKIRLEETQGSREKPRTRICESEPKAEPLFVPHAAGWGGWI
jgi:hypothetical protein